MPAGVKHRSAPHYPDKRIDVCGIPQMRLIHYLYQQVVVGITPRGHCVNNKSRAGAADPKQQETTEQSKVGPSPWAQLPALHHIVLGVHARWWMSVPYAVPIL